MFIQTESTPNPATLKFLPGREVMGEGAVADFPDREAAAALAAGRALFEIPAVSRVFFGADFISVTKADGEWQHLKPAILGAIMEHFTQGRAADRRQRRRSGRGRQGLCRRRGRDRRPDQGSDRDPRAPGRGQ